MKTKTVISVRATKALDQRITRAAKILKMSRADLVRWSLEQTAEAVLRRGHEPKS